jgi:hypothetical protein
LLSKKSGLTISENEFELKFKPFIQLKIIICVNDSCGNNFRLTNDEILQLIRKENSTCELVLHGIVLITCPLCKTAQQLNCLDIIGDYPKPSINIKSKQ